MGAMTYRDYLCVGELLDLQRMRSDGPEHDEMLFIVVHQVYELWFKQVLHELDRLVEHMDDDQLVRASTSSSASGPSSRRWSGSSTCSRR